VRRLAPVVGVAAVLAALALMLLLLVPLGEPDQPAGEATDPLDRAGPAPQVDPTARAAMDRSTDALSSWSYWGTQIVTAKSAGDVVSQVVEVTHTPVDGTTVRSSTGGPSVTAAAHGAEPSLVGGGAVALMARHYSLRMGTPDRVAGREADVVEAVRPGSDGLLVARFWLDRESGVVLRREVYDGAGDPVRVSAFVDVDLERTPSATATPESAEGRAWSTTLDAAALDRMKRKGWWDCPDSLPGPLPLVDARRGGEGKAVVHLSYADGISSISVFQQRGTLDRSQLRGYRRTEVAGDQVWVKDAVPQRVMWSSGGTVYLVLADAPRRTVDRAVVVLHAGATQGQKGPVDRLGRGLDRVASWFNPFE
jgi:sigma-E factor negative regulatory protein RseB